ncbi:asparagine synthase (glutamine-hydrolyzing) [Lutimonas halocynthiae]|uniref:asparagine synthase (glutamine-hydrolyzing) n=1 Tax=Lutimonas halocynthiae TaxID=1446477 RepID=UPI0025B471D0|nr:asparagine synthase (glutamine-hydrolyzing) [Lutimonas halocynthiae]MDN3643385.1 asparagine synthase (glutamine-hydrolyzing) [Lutimonas halocynthiae]
MCGITGIVNFKNQKVQKSKIDSMMAQMKHRGPDDEGIFIEDSIGFGFVRLSILDLSPAGHQPMFSHDDRYVIIFNGEVYNYIEIREELKHKYTFNSGSDTEVILAAYQEWGEACLEKFNGMFALAIYDRETQDIFAARDRFGIKPFYYYSDDDQFIFASEIKSILPLLDKKEPNDKIIFDYLLFNRTDHSEETFFKGIKKLNHGSFLKISNQKVTEKKWYDLSEKIVKEKNLSPEEYRKLFKDSIKLRLRADVPVGVSLSGGIDSSCIVSSVVEDFQLKDLNTFSAVYGKSETSDESEYIDEYKGIVKNMFYTTPDAESFFNDFDSFIDAHNEPVPDIGPYAQFKVMELASEHVTVTLDGQGADEQLAGYHYFFGSYYLELIKKMKLIKLFQENVYYLKKHNSLNAIKFFFYYLLPSSLQNKVGSQKFPSINESFFNRYKRSSDVNKKLYSPKNLNQLLFQHFEYKLEHLLRWEDLNSMHFSIESRVPFLDHRLVEATLSTPSDQKIHKGETKHLLRKALEDILPHKIANRKDKKGFSNPREKWFRTKEFSTYILELINSDSFKERGYFNSKIANIQYQKHLEGKVDISKEIWKWVNLELWFRKFID